jgi:ferrous iron transport protein B
LYSGGGKHRRPGRGGNLDLGHTHIHGLSLMAHLGDMLNPLGLALGLDGVILTAFLFGFPANEIVLPILLMSYVSAGEMVQIKNLAALHGILTANGWTALTATSMMLFSLLHYPCGTTILTIFKETRSLKWTALAVLLPLSIAVLITFAIHQIAAGFKPHIDMANKPQILSNR